MEAFLADVVLDQPWADPELPSLVGVDESGAVVGFVASHARRLRVGDRTIRAACCSHLVVDPGQPAGALGMRLLARFMAGPQEFSFSDTAIEVVARLWRAVGGHVDHTRSLSWSKTLRPAALAGRLLAGSVVRRSLATGLAPVRPLPLDVRKPAAEDDRLTATPLTPGNLVTGGEVVTGWLPVRTAWDEAFATWRLLALERRVGQGRLVARMLHRGEVPVGWYVYVKGPAGQGYVLQVAGRKREIDAVVGELFAAARDEGVVLLTGRLEPQLLEALRARDCAVGFDTRTVVHSHDERLLAEIGASGALLSRLDGEWWA